MQKVILAVVNLFEMYIVGGTVEEDKIDEHVVMIFHLVGYK